MKRIVLPAMIAMTAFAALAQPTGYPEIGTVYATSTTSKDGMREQSSRLTGFDGRFFVFETTGDGDSFTLLPFCSYCDPEEVAEDMAAYEALWPLRVGATARIRRTEEQGVWFHQIEVTGKERVLTPFGEIDAFVVIEKAQGGGGNPWRRAATTWWSEEMKTPVKWDARDSNGDFWTWRLERFDRP